MFGQNKLRREKKKNKKTTEALQNEINNLRNPAPEDPLQQQEKVNKIADEQKAKDKAAREEGKAYSDEVLSRQYEGLTPEEKIAYQESADAQINRDLQGYNQKLLAQQGRRGVKGGAAFAQKEDLARLGIDAQQQTKRDLSALDKKTEMQKLAAAYNIEQGEVAQSQARNQMALDALNSYDEKKYLKWLSDQANKLFQKV